MTKQARAQNQAIIEAFGDTVGTGPRDGPLRHMYRNHHVLVRDEYVVEVRELLENTGFMAMRRRPQASATRLPDGSGSPAAPGEAVIHGVRLLHLDGDNQDPLAAMDVIINGGQGYQGMGAGVAAPDHLVSITGESGPCPAHEPDPVPGDTPLDPLPTPDTGAGKGIRVVVVDTGIDFASVEKQPWLRGVRGDRDSDIEENTPHPLRYYAGHGTFIAGMVRMVAPRAQVIVRRGFGPMGAVFESQLVRTLDRVLARDHPDVISLSAGTYTFDATGLMTFGAFARNRLRHHKGVAFVAAAGNNDRRKAFWPAAAPWTVSVGSLDKTWRSRADFSNHGGWVDVYAPGEDLVNAFPAGQYTYREPPRKGAAATFTGLARWSGTSFSTPLVAGLIAARMWRTGENGSEAARRLLADAHIRHQFGVGAVLLPR